MEYFVVYYRSGMFRPQFLGIFRQLVSFLTPAAYAATNLPEVLRA